MAAPSITSRPLKQQALSSRTPRSNLLAAAARPLASKPIFARILASKEKPIPAGMGFFMSIIFRVQRYFHCCGEVGEVGVVGAVGEPTPGPFENTPLLPFWIPLPFVPPTGCPIVPRF